jgi:hypothetical protein
MGVFEGGKAVLLSARILLAPGISSAKTVAPLNSPVFWAKSEVLPLSAEDLDQLLSEAAAGRISLGGLECMLALDPSFPPHVLYLPGYPPSFGGDQSAPRLPTLMVTGGNRHAAVDKVVKPAELDWILRALDPPFADLADLHGYYSLPPPSQSGDASLIEVVARPPVELDARSMVQEQRAHIRVLAVKGANLKDVSVGFRGVGGSGGVIRGMVAPDRFSWHETDKLFEGEAIVEIGDIPTVQCFLSYGGSGIHQWWIVDPERLLNPRHAIHSAFDPDLAVLKRLLFESRKSDSRSFEDGVAMLLGMLGFSATQHGRSQKLSDAPDIIAITPAGNVVVVECTIGLPDQDDQVAKALQRAEALRRALARAGWSGVQVLPVVVSALPHAEIKGQKEDAENKGVAVACLDDIEKALTQMRVPVDAERLFRGTVERLSTPRILTD